MALRIMRGGVYAKAYDEDTHEEVLVSFSDDGTDKWAEIGRVMSHTSIMDQHKHQAAVSEDGCLKAGDFAGGMPIAGYDLAGADTYVTMLTANRECRHCAVTLTATNGVTICLDGNGTDHLHFKPSGTTGGTQVYDGVLIPKGASVLAKNLVAGANYAKLSMSVW